MATNKGNVGIIIGVSVLLVGVASYFIYRGIKSSRDARKMLEEQAKKGSAPQSASPSGEVKEETIPTTTPEATPTQTTPPPSNLIIQPKSQSVLREKPSTLSRKLNTFGSGVQIQVEGVTNVGGYQWFKITDPSTKLVGYIRSDVVNIVK